MDNASSYQDDELLNRLATGDTAAFATLYHRYFNQVFYFARRFLTDVQAAEDLTTEILLKAWQKRTDFGNIQQFGGFLYTSTRNACLNAIKQEQARTRKQRELVALLENESQPAKEEQLLTAALLQHIYEAIENLPPQEKKIFRLAYLEGMSNEDIATAIGINNQSVRNSKARALKTLRLSIREKGMLALFLWLLSHH